MSFVLNSLLQTGLLCWNCKIDIHANDTAISTTLLINVLSDFQVYEEIAKLWHNKFSFSRIRMVRFKGLVDFTVSFLLLKKPRNLQTFTRVSKLAYPR